MKRSHVLPLLLLVSVASCDGDKSSQQQSLMDASRQELASALDERDRLIALVREISEDMDSIKRLENILSMDDRMHGDTRSRHRRVLSDIASIQSTLAQRRRQLAELEAQLKESQFYNNDLEAVIGSLRRNLDMQTREVNSLREKLCTATGEITELNEAVDSLNTTIVTVTEERDSIQSTATRLEDELNACYYVAAGKSQLKTHKIIETGFLRRSKLMKGEFDRNFFNIADKRNLDSIETHAKKARILTNHPVESYEIVDRNGSKLIVLKDPAKFWSLSNYLVIQTD